MVWLAVTAAMEFFCFLGQEKGVELSTACCVAGWPIIAVAAVDCGTGFE